MTFQASTYDHFVSQALALVTTSMSSSSDLEWANPLDEANEIEAAPPFGYVPEIEFRNLSWTDHLAGSRFPTLAGWHKNDEASIGVQ